MQLITKEIQKKLTKNSKKSKLMAGLISKYSPESVKPVLKLFLNNATWLISEIDEDEDTMFGLCDLGLGYVELGYVSLKEIKETKGFMGLGVERDMYFSTDETLEQWAEKSSTRIAA